MRRFWRDLDASGFLMWLALLLILLAISPTPAIKTLLASLV